MTLLTWQKRRNLEKSLKDFLIQQINSQSLTIIDECGVERAPEVQVGFARDESWKLPVITVYVDNILSPRSCIGNNKRQDEYLLIMDIRALDIGMQLDLSDWLTTTINDGWIFNDYQPNGADPQNPIKTQAGFVSIDFISNLPIRLGENVDLYDKFRQNITISTTITLL